MSRNRAGVMSQNRIEAMSQNKIEALSLNRIGVMSGDVRGAVSLLESLQGSCKLVNSLSLFLSSLFQRSSGLVITFTICKVIKTLLCLKSSNQIIT